MGFPNSGKERTNDYILIGKVIKAHGIKGAVAVLSFSGCPANFKSYKKIYLVGRDSDLYSPYTVLLSRSQGKSAILQLDGVATRDDAEALCGAQVWLEKTALLPLAADEYYWYEIEGFRVLTAEGRELGTVTALFSTKAHDIMVLSGGGKEYLIPLRREIIVRKDNRRRILVIDPPAGLLDLND